jgi:metallophosphoesterase superfamily enzyme
MRENKMNLNEYLIENDRHIGDVVILNSVGTALDKVSGDTFPMMVDNTIGVDEPMNIMEMEINGDSYEWFESLSDTDKEAVDGVMFNLSYNDISKEELELYNSVPPCSSMTPVGDK